MKKAIKYIYDANPFYVHWKKHVCPRCGGKVEQRFVSKIVNSKSPEAKDYDFSVGDAYFVGDVEFRTRYFYCPKCQLDISFQEMKKFEKGQAESVVYKKQSRHEKRQIYRSSLLAVLGGLLIIALICVAFVLPTIRRDLECSHFPGGGTWVCDDLNLSINFDDYTAVFQSGQQTVTCEMIREFNSNYIVLENGVTYGALFSGECVDLSDTVLKIEESETERIYLFRKAESH